MTVSERLLTVVHTSLGEQPESIVSGRGCNRRREHFKPTRTLAHRPGEGVDETPLKLVFFP